MERHVIRLLHNLPYKRMTLQKIGDMFGVSREWIRLIQKDIITRIRTKNKYKAWREENEDWHEG